MSGKKSLAILSALGLAFSSTAVYAAKTIPTDDSGYKGTIPVVEAQSGYEVSIAALALKPGASNLNYVIYNKELPTQSPTWSEQELRPEYSAGFELGFRYLFSETRDIKLDWTHLSTNTSSSVAADSVSYFLGPDYEIGPAGIPIRNASGNVKFRYDVVNLDVGQYLDFVPHVQMRFFAGLSTGFLREEVNATYTGNTIIGAHQGPFSTNQDVTSNFTGIGPRVGIESTYSMDNGFGVLGEAAASALIGSSYSKTSYLSSAQELLDMYGQTSNYQRIVDQNITQVVPGLDGKLGLFYKHKFGRSNLFTVELGYQAAVYMNAINQYLPGTLVTPLETGGIFVATMNHTLSNYSVQGPFLKAALRFA